MTHLRYPILVWRDAAGAGNAVLAGDFDCAAATAPTEAEAVDQLRELLEWRCESEPWNRDADLEDAALEVFDVTVRPQYRAGQRLIPCPETVRLRVPCVTGRQASGLRLGVVPHLDVRFNFRQPEEVRSLLTHYVHEALQGLSPAELATRLPPRGCRLDSILLVTSAAEPRPVAPERRPELEVLFAVADPIAATRNRRASTFAYGREALLATLGDWLASRPANVLLVGEPGVGKSTLLATAARRLRNGKSGTGDRPPDEASETGAEDTTVPRCWRTNAGRLIAGMRYLGEWEGRCEQVIQRLAAIDGLLVVENLLELLAVGGQGPGDSVAAFLLPYLQRGELRLAAEANPAELEACRRLLPGLLDVFRVLPVPNFADHEAIQVLERIARSRSGPARTEFDPGSIPLTHRLFKRFLPHAAFPGPAADFVRALADTRGPAPGPVGPDQVIQAFVRQTGLPELFLRDELPLRVEEVRARFASRILGQPDATAAAARVVTTIKADLADPHRPLGVLLFSGPTGVGKTALAREIVEFCFGADGGRDHFVRLDMSEYGGTGAALRLLGDARGQPAAWIRQVRCQPFGVVLFDEIEKAAPEVFDVLLALLDEGRLTDRFGRITWFRGTLLILTSNLGAGSPGISGFGNTPEPAPEAEVARFFRPEFFNRLDAVIPFHPLAAADVQAIARKELADLAGREGFAAARLRLTWSDRLVTRLAREGYDHRFGARPLQRALERLVVTPLARWRIAHPAVRDTELQLDLDDDAGLMIRPVQF